MIGLVMFTGAALVSALSHSLPMLTLGRALQGLGAAGMHNGVDLAGIADGQRPRREAAQHREAAVFKLVGLVVREAVEHWYRVDPRGRKPLDVHRAESDRHPLGER
jgi:hypothetical protein